MFQNQLLISRLDLAHNSFSDFEGRDIIIGFNEPQFKNSSKNSSEYDLDAKLNARFITHFIPSVYIARKMKRRPRLMIVSGINMAFLWNARSNEEKKIMLANNNIKFDFLRSFFECFCAEDFSIVEYIVSQDVLKIPEHEIMQLWDDIFAQYPEELEEIRFQFAKFLFPQKFNVQQFSDLDEDQKQALDYVDVGKACKYAIGHSFVFADINFKGNYIHPENGYISIGNEHEQYFNVVRNLMNTYIQSKGLKLAGRSIEVIDNYHVVLNDTFRVPPPYNGYYKLAGSRNNRRRLLMEVTYENERTLNFYNDQQKLQEQMADMYNNFLKQSDYQIFWDDYRKRYFDLKKRYTEAYGITRDW